MESEFEDSDDAPVEPPPPPSRRAAPRSLRPPSPEAVPAPTDPAPAPAALDATDVGAMTVADLKAALRERGLGVSGTKDVLQGRLIEALDRDDTAPAAAPASAPAPALAGGSVSVVDGAGGEKPGADDLLRALDRALDEWYGSKEGEAGQVRESARAHTHTQYKRARARTHSAHFRILATLSVPPLPPLDAVMGTPCSGSGQEEGGSI